MNENAIIYFSVNDWGPGNFYPDTDNFRKWLVEEPENYFGNDNWVKENKLCIVVDMIDMSCNYTVSAPIQWVKENCLEILGSDFQYFPDEGKEYPEQDHLFTPFLEYLEENIGLHYDY